MPYARHASYDTKMRLSRPQDVQRARRDRTTMRRLIATVLLITIPVIAAEKQHVAAVRKAPDAFTLACPDKDVVAAYAMAFDVIEGNIKPWKRGLLEAEAPAFMAGAGYASPWTRDASYNTYFGAGLVFPEVARNTLLSVLAEVDGKVRITGQYWDSVAWVTGAWALYTFTGDRTLLRRAYEAARNSLQFFRETEFNESTGLYCGPGWSDGVAGYPAPYDQAGGSSFILDYARHNEGIDKIRMQALSTNCLYYHAYRIAAWMARRLAATDEEADGFERAAEALSRAINKHLWLADAGYYGYFLDPHGKIDRSMEALGHAHAILFGVAPEDRAASVLERQYVSPHGIPCVWPIFPRFTRDAPGLFAKIAGVLTANGANIIDAQLNTSVRGQAIDVFWVTDPTHRPLNDSEILERIRGEMEVAIKGEVEVDRIVEGRFKRRLLSWTRRPPLVTVDNDVSALETVVEVQADDRRGLLYTIACVFHELGLTIDRARITTLVDRVIDVFYIRNGLGEKVNSSQQLDLVRRRLLEAIEG